MLKSIKISLTRASDWSTAIKIVVNIDESVFRMPIYSVQTNYIVMNIDESMFCIPIYSVQGRYNPNLWLDRQMAPVVS